MSKRIRRGRIVRVDQSFIQKYKRYDLNSEDTWHVVNVVPVCGDKKVANMVNTRTRTKADVFTCNLKLV